MGTMKKWAAYRLRYWLYFGLGLGRYMLFLNIVWRVWDVLPDGEAYRLSWSMAWDVARDVHEVPR